MDTRFNNFIPQLWGYFLCTTLFLVTNFYWPGGNTIQVQFLAWEFGAMAVIVFSYLYYPVRYSKNPWPVFYLIYAFINSFTHKLMQFTLIGVTQVLLFTIAYFALANSLEEKHIKVLKKAIVFIACFNSFFGVLQYFGYSPVFETKEVMGFLGQKWNFAALCGLALPFAIEMGWIPSLLILTGVFLADKYAVYIPLFLCLFMNRNRLKVNQKLYFSLILGALAVLGIKKYLWLTASPDHWHGDYELKVLPRIRHWKAMFKWTCARPIDGWGINSFSSLIFDRQHAGNYPEMHNEPLQVLFEGGMLAAVFVIGWARRIIDRAKMFSLSDTESSLFIFVCTSFFHSVFHQGNMLFLFLIILAIVEVEHAKNDQFKGSIPSGRGSEAMPVPSRHLPALVEPAASNGRPEWQPCG